MRMKRRRIWKKRINRGRKRKRRKGRKRSMKMNITRT
jgi:hypothetical protein